MLPPQLAGKVPVKALSPSSSSDMAGKPSCPPQLSGNDPARIERCHVMHASNYFMFAQQP